MLRELANVVVRLASCLKDHSKRARLLMTRIHLQGGWPRELQVGKSNLSPCKDYEANPPGSHIHGYGGKGDWKQLAWIYQGQTVPSKPDKKVGSMDKRTAVHVIYLNFCMAFSHPP